MKHSNFDISNFFVNNYHIHLLFLMPQILTLITIFQSLDSSIFHFLTDPQPLSSSLTYLLNHY